MDEFLDYVEVEGKDGELLWYCPDCGEYLDLNDPDDRCECDPFYYLDGYLDDD